MPLTQKKSLIFSFIRWLQVIDLITFNFEDVYGQLFSKPENTESTSNSNVIGSKEENREMDCQDSFNKTGSKASLYINMSLHFILL